MIRQVGQFFFEKKNQKTFALGIVRFHRLGLKVQKFFAELPFKKATVSFLNLGCVK